MIHQYFTEIKALLDKVLTEEATQLEEAAQRLAASIAKGGVVHLFGCGHSHLLTEEVFYRAGGLACVRPIFVTDLMLHEGAVRSSLLERMPEYGKTVLRPGDIEPGEVLIVLSTSGRNPVPIDVALTAKGQGAQVIAITSKAYSDSQPSRHPSGQRLYEVADLVIDSHAPAGDALLSLPGVPVPFAPSSTAVGTVVLQSMMARTIELLHAQGVEPPIFLSGNLDGADERNGRLIAQYQGRIRNLR